MNDDDLERAARAAVAALVAVHAPRPWSDRRRVSWYPDRSGRGCGPGRRRSLVGGDRHPGVR